MRLRDSSFAKWSNYFCFPCLMTISLGVKSIFNKFPKNIMTYLLVNILLGNKTKKSGQTNSKMINVRLCRTISKYLRSIKIQGKQTADGSKQIDSWAILRKGVRHERARDPLHENCFATDTYTLFLLQERCFSSPGRNILSFLPILGWKYSMTCIILKL